MEKLFVVPCRAVRRYLIAGSIIACCLAMLTLGSAESSVTLAWDRTSYPSAVGYRIYAREENTATATTFNVLGLTQVTVPGLKEGLRYTFTVTSYNASGVESIPSNTAEFVVPVSLNLLHGTTPN